MGLYLDTRSNTNVAIGICDRCRFKYAIVDLCADRNSPGLRVCDKCNDQYDPWRLPAKRPDNITVQYPRPDVDISTE